MPRQLVFAPQSNPAPSSRAPGRMRVSDANATFIPTRFSLCSRGNDGSFALLSWRRPCHPGGNRRSAFRAPAIPARQAQFQS